MVPVIKSRARTQKRTRRSNGFAMGSTQTPAMSGKVLGKEEWRWGGEKGWEGGAGGGVRAAGAEPSEHGRQLCRTPRDPAFPAP